MKKYIKIFWAIALIMAGSAESFAQDIENSPLVLGKIVPYPMKITYDKTSHLIFPSAIRYVDLGSEYLIAGKAEQAENVLRVKASVKDFQAQTNLSVITNDGRFYSFDVHYSCDPQTLSYDIEKIQKALEKTGSDHIYFEELGSNSPWLTDLVMKSIYSDNKRFVKGIGSKSFGIAFILKGIYILEGKYYFHTQLSNQTNVPFHIDFINFKVIDKKKARRTVLQQSTITPVRMYKPLGEINAQQSEQNIFLLDQFTLADDKILLIEIFEKNGGRNQTLKVENSDLIKARLVKDMHLKF